MGPVAQEDESLAGAGQARADRVDLREHRPLLGRRVVEVAADDHEVEALEQLRVARPGLDELRDALDTVESRHREEQRKPSRRSGSDPTAVQSERIAGASCATGCLAAVSTAIPSGTVQTRSGRTASNEAEQRAQLPLGTRSGQHRQRVRLSQHPFDEPRPEHVVVLEIGGRKVSRSSRPAASLSRRTECGSGARVNTTGTPSLRKTRAATNVPTSAKRR